MSRAWLACGHPVGYAAPDVAGLGSECPARARQLIVRKRGSGHRPFRHLTDAALHASSQSINASPAFWRQFTAAGSRESSSCDPPRVVVGRGRSRLVDGLATGAIARGLRLLGADAGRRTPSRHGSCHSRRRPLRCPLMIDCRSRVPREEGRRGGEASHVLRVGKRARRATVQTRHTRPRRSHLSTATTRLAATAIARIRSHTSESMGAVSKTAFMAGT